MTLLVFMGISLLLILCAFRFTKNNWLNRLITGVVLFLSPFLYPLILPLLFESNMLQDLDDVASLVIFHLLTSLGGVTVIIASFFTYGLNSKKG